MAGFSDKPRPFFRLSPAQRSEAMCFGMTRGEIFGRFDVNYWRLTPLLQQRLSAPMFPLAAVGDLVELVQYGSSALANKEDRGVPILRMNNLQKEGWDLSDIKHIEVSDVELERYRLEAGDLLFNRTNSKELVGKCEVFSEPDDWVFASYLIRVRFDTSKVLPRFAADFLNSQTGRLQIDRLSRQIIGMTNINAEELKEIVLPIPGDRAKQHELVEAMNAARATRQRQLAEADALLAGLDGYLLDALGLSLPAQPKTVFAIQSRDLKGPINPERYRGMQLEKALPFSTQVSDAVEWLQLRASPEKDAPEDLWDWIRIDDLPNRPWQIDSVRTERGAGIVGNFFEVQENDILIARLGPTILNAKFVLCPKLSRRTIASTEFLVLRCRSGWQAHAVLWLLRTQIYRDIMYARSRGATPSRFRLDGGDLLSLPFPAMDELLQTEIAAEVERRQHEAQRLRGEADLSWQEAKAWFETQLLGEAAS